MSLSSTDDKAATGVGGSGGRGPRPRYILFLLLLILAGVVYIAVMLTRNAPPKGQFYQLVPYRNGSDTTGVGGSGGKGPNPKLIDALLIYPALKDSTNSDCPCAPKMYALVRDTTGTDTTSGKKGPK